MTGSDKKTAFPAPELVKKYTAELLHLHKEHLHEPTMPQATVQKTIPVRHVIPPPEILPPGEVYGTLQLEVTSKNTAVPIENAFITVLADDETRRTLLHFASTDKSGLTPPISLPARPTGQGSQAYFLKITADGCYPVEKPHVPVFANVKTILPVQLMPVASEETISLL